MLRFLIDENLPRIVGGVFKLSGFVVEHVGSNPSLRQKSDEAIFDYAVEQKSVIVTRDLGFANPTKFPLHKIMGLVIIRFPNEVRIATLCKEIERLVDAFEEKDFHNLIIIEPGSVRKREL